MLKNIPECRHFNKAWKNQKVLDKNLKSAILIIVMITDLEGMIMAIRKYSRQRELIKEFLMTRKDHPTADMVYMNVRRMNPNISLGTVYRNLTRLAEDGEINRLNVDRKSVV